MPIQFRCDACGRKLSVGRRKGGTSTSCPRCLTPLVIPFAVEPHVAFAQLEDPSAKSKSHASVGAMSSIYSSRDSMTSASVRKKRHPTIESAKVHRATRVLVGALGLLAFFVLAILAYQQDQLDKARIREKLAATAEPSVLDKQNERIENLVDLKNGIFDLKDEHKDEQVHEPVDGQLDFDPFERFAAKGARDNPNVPNAAGQAGFPVVENRPFLGGGAQAEAQRSLEPIPPNAPGELVAGNPNGNRNRMVNRVVVRNNIQVPIDLNGSSFPPIAIDRAGITVVEIQNLGSPFDPAPGAEIGASNDIVSKPVSMKRFLQRDEEVVREKLSRVPEIKFQLGRSSTTSGGKTQRSKNVSMSHPVLKLAESRAELQGLPFRDAQAGVMGFERAMDMQHYGAIVKSSILPMLSRRMESPVRSASITQLVSLGGRVPEFGASLRATNVQFPQAVPAIRHLMMGEELNVRQGMIEILSRIPGQEASVALAKQALFDINQEIRERAISALAVRTEDEYADVLVEGFRYPFAPVVEHAADAVATLNLKSVAPKLKQMLTEPNPRAPYASKDGFRIREVVKINHLASCTLCHATTDSLNSPVLGLVPIRGTPLPPNNVDVKSIPVSALAKSGFKVVRGDVAYLHQDFSVLQPVEGAGAWSAYQTYDYLVRTRPATPEELSKDWNLAKGYSEALIYTIRELTGDKKEDLEAITFVFSAFERPRK